VTGAWGRSPLVVGHRGGRGPGWPAENTIDAFEQAREQGAAAIELDVRSCAGGEVVVFHDESLSRMPRGRDERRVCEVTLPALREIDLGDGAQVPVLAEVLSWARQRGIAVNVEMKHDVPDRLHLARRTARLVRESRADVLLSSFDPLLLVAAAAFAPSVSRALLVHERQTGAALALREVARPPLVAAIHLERTQASLPAMERYLGRGLRVGVWTVDDEEEARQLVRGGVATLITDSPGALLSALGRT
jgi:glycerophosphoryl diester phosphodiesterase